MLLCGAAGRVKVKPRRVGENDSTIPAACPTVPQHPGGSGWVAFLPGLWGPGTTLCQAP